jgi:hypothetical protein
MPGVLYKKERELLEFLAQFQKQYGYSPTLVEMAKGTGHKSVSTIHTIIRNLVEKGYIQKVDGNARVLRIIEDNISPNMYKVSPSIELPLMGFIAAGNHYSTNIKPSRAIKCESDFRSEGHRLIAENVDFVFGHVDQNKARFQNNGIFIEARLVSTNSNLRANAPHPKRALWRRSGT